MSAIKAPIYEDPTWTPPPPENAYGPIVSGFEIEQALAKIIREWMPDYLLAMEHQRGLPPGKLPTYKTEAPTSWDAARLREDQLPACAFVSTGTDGRPDTFNSDGSYNAKWRVECVSVCSARGNGQARKLAQWYTAAVRALLVQWPLTDTRLNLLRIDLLGERYQTRNPTEERTLGEGVAVVLVHAAAITYRTAGPIPMYLPGDVGDLPTVVDHDIVIEKDEEE